MCFLGHRFTNTFTFVDSKCILLMVHTVWTILWCELLRTSAWEPILFMCKTIAKVVKVLLTSLAVLRVPASTNMTRPYQSRISRIALGPLSCSVVATWKPQQDTVPKSQQAPWDWLASPYKAWDCKQEGALVTNIGRKSAESSLRCGVESRWSVTMIASD